MGNSADEGLRVPDEFQHSVENDRVRRNPRRRASDPASTRDGGLAQFALIADPATISGGSSGSKRDNRDEEVERLRGALHARSFEIATPSHERTTARAEKPRVRGALLGSAEARQLAQEARAREQVSRAALASAHEALRSEATTTGSSVSQPAKTTHGWQQRSPVRPVPEPAAASSWTQKSLVTEPTTATAATTMPSFDAVRTDPRPDERLAARAEIRELRATLAIARDTTIGQKKEITALRRRLAEQDGLLRSLEEARSEQSRLYDQLRSNERETQTRDAERISLEQTLAARESEIAARGAQLDQLRERFDVQDRALNDARLQFEQERSRSTATQELLARLRHTLGIAHASEASSISMRSPAAPPDPSTAAGASAFPSEDSNFDPEWLMDEPNLQERTTQEPILEARSTTRPRPAIFEPWQDDQVRRNFGPMGIDNIVDLLRAPLARRTSSAHPEQQIVLLGHGALRWATTLAEGLVQNGTAPFILHVADPDQGEWSTVHGIAQESPIRDFLCPLPFPKSPEALADSLSSLGPAALISRDFLSRIDDVTPWLDVLSEFSETGSCLLFSECTGVGPVDVPDEIKALGDRIWQLMPSRYTRIENTESCFESWHEAFCGSRTDLGNDLLSLLKSRFPLEMLAQFGFLAEPFLAHPIGSNFDSEAARDRKFLSQIADLDDRKIEAGTVPALHLVAIVDSEAER